MVSSAFSRIVCVYSEESSAHVVLSVYSFKDVLTFSPSVFGKSFTPLPFQAQSQRNVGSAILRLTVCQVLVVSVNPGSKETAPFAVQSHVSVLQLSTEKTVTGSKYSECLCSGLLPDSSCSLCVSLA